MRHVKRYILTGVVLGLFSWGREANAQDAQVRSLLSTELLGRPTNASIDIGLVADGPIDVKIDYGTTPSTYSAQATGTFASTVNVGGSQVVVADLVINGLQTNTRYYYRLSWRAAGTSDWTVREEHSFWTQRPEKSTFKFTVQSDSHQSSFAGGFYNASLYDTQMRNVQADAPDFMFDLGDAIGMDDVTNVATARGRYLDQRKFFQIPGSSAPVFLAPGNHEDEEGWNLDDNSDPTLTLPVMSANARKSLFLNPVPNKFYTGNAETQQGIDGDMLRGDYYAFEWGDALFVAFDPFWYTKVKPFSGTLGGEPNDETAIGNRWDWTLGDAQYQWLTDTLRNSTKKFKFLFAHHPTTGTGTQGDYSRGGANAAPYCEWGGYNPADSLWTFPGHRPNWQQPIHSLMVETGVSAFFHGHDHFYAYEKRDGIVYQEIPHPAHPGYDGGAFASQNATDYSGAIKTANNSGHLRVTVSRSTDNDALATVDYVRAFRAEDSAKGTNRSLEYSYTIAPVAPHARPAPVDDTVSVYEDATATLNVLDNDANKDKLNILGVTQGSNAKISVNGKTAVDYTPKPNYCGADSFFYWVTDGLVIARATVNVTVQCINDAPVAADYTVTGKPAELVTVDAAKDCTDVDGSCVRTSVTISAQPLHGTIVSNSNGSVTYQSAKDFTGTDKFDYQICDNATPTPACDTGTVTIQVKCAGVADCDDQDFCTVDSCDAATGLCGHSANPCSDGLDCTEDGCSAGSCTHVAHNERCDDSVACTANACDLAKGCVYTAHNELCNDNVTCTTDTCDVSKGCVFTPHNEACNDGNGCTDDTCTATGCKNDPNNTCPPPGTGGSTGAGGNATGVGGNQAGGSPNAGGSIGVGGVGTSAGAMGIGGTLAVDCDAGDDAEGGLCVADASADAFLDVAAQGSGGAGGAASGAGGSGVGAGGETTGAGGETTGAGGETTGAGGETTGAGGETTGAGGETTGAGGETTGAGGQAPGAGGSSLATLVDGAAPDSGSALRKDASADADAASDASNPGAAEGGGCACSTAGRRSPSALFGLFVAAASVLVRRRSRR